MKKIFNKKIKPKIILYELNEVPRRLFNHYVAEFPNSAFAQIANEGEVFDTYNYDDGELHPWSTWPTVHRGFNLSSTANINHSVKYQDKIFDLNVFGLELVERDIGAGYYKQEV
tara:strand:- start:1463 stop:1804 length:342 start_codon:yes stop_codon:yes gene_type:complete